VVRVFCRDTEATGFPASLAGAADAVFLDLPGPQRVAASAVASLRPDGMLCSFSPCIEQVQRMCGALAEQGMVDIRTIEVLEREYEFQHKALLLPMPPPGGAADAEAAAVPAAGEGGDAPAAGSKRRREEDSGAAEAGAGASAEAAAAPMEAQAGEAAAAAAVAVAAGKGVGEAERRRGGGATNVPLPRAPSRLLTWPAAEARGHTGYLTFARKPTEQLAPGAAAAAADDAA
jgi:hypothetical protein